MNTWRFVLVWISASCALGFVAGFVLAWLEDDEPWFSDDE